MFWTYAGYIFATNLAFGILTVSAPAALLDGSVLAAAVTGFISLYWTTRVVLQLAIFDRGVAAGNALFRLAEVMYVTAFAYVAIVNGVAAVHNL